MRVFLLSFLFIFNVLHCIAQFFPAEGASLHYRIVHFRDSNFQAPGTVKLELAAGDVTDDKSFAQHLVLTTRQVANRLVAEVPDFGCSYTWRISGVAKGSKKGGFHHFNTLLPKGLDTTARRLRIIHPAERYADGYVLTDGAGAMYDLRGRLVWFVPPMPGQQDCRRDIEDIEVTPNGTITFITGTLKAYEMSYEGEVLWQSPTSGDGMLHHEFTRTTKGHYLIGGMEVLPWKLNTPPAAGGSLYTIYDNPAQATEQRPDRPPFHFETIDEYDGAGKLVWRWRLVDYFRHSDLNAYCPPGMNQSFDMHLNAFYFDEERKKIYVSFKHINRIIEIDYPGGAVTNTFGRIFGADAPRAGAGRDLFCGQHGCKRGSGNKLYLYNNNACGADGNGQPQVLRFEPGRRKGELEGIWKMDCIYDGIAGPIPPISGYTRGGNVVPLPGGAVFVSMNEPFSKMFIADQGKHVVWSAVVERYDQEQRVWALVPMYRASMIPDRRSLDRLIFGGR